MLFIQQGGGKNRFFSPRPLLLNADTNTDYNRFGIIYPFRNTQYVYHHKGYLFNF